ncbi:uncharacterized protein LOC122856617 [Aphidius gifuensis]|uniref:uncharacterized protein LOC122856617 n=1 Tax=Aphidius gifuensis TaxID=684658 RepID=UPI001CDC6FD7|nr:uncharacterized protein LOC122856617 [Aphidius gifuensis]
MSKQPTRQLSLQQVPKRTSQIRRQRSADDQRTNESNMLLYHSISNQPIRSRRDKSSWVSTDRPKVRIAWTSSIEKEPKVEIIASRIGTASNKRNNINGNSSVTSSVIGNDKATILYSRQELAERLRLAWKQREANKSNIDIFLAHDMTTEERCDSRMSSSSVDDKNSHDNEEQIKADVVNSTDDPSTVFPVNNNNDDRLSKSKYQVGNYANVFDKNVKITMIQDARSKRASFQSGTNLAFNGNLPRTTIVSPLIKESSDKLEKLKDKTNNNTLTDQKTKRTNSAPPLQRRIGLTNIVASKPRVNIIIDTPKISKPRDPLSAQKIDKKESKDCEKINSNLDNSSVKNLSSTSATSTERVVKTNKKRSRNGKRRVDDFSKKNERTKSTCDIVTMVSLVSDADSDSDVEKNSPRDDKLVRQLKCNFPTTPIIKSCPLTINSGNLTNSIIDNSNNSLIPRRVIKSVSFQQDYSAIDAADIQHNDFIPKIIQDNDVRTNWQTTCDDDPKLSSKNSINYWQGIIEESSTLTDREKRCLVVPIGDQRDKKRKFQIQKIKNNTTKNEEHQPNIIQMDMKDFGSGRSVSSGGLNETTVRSGSSVTLTASISKLVKSSSLDQDFVDQEAVDADVEPHLRTTKEKECWHLYRKMCDKGVCVSFDTVLRGMLTPTEYRLRRREITQQI